MLVLPPIPDLGTRVSYDVLVDPKSGRPRAENLQISDGVQAAAPPSVALPSTIAQGSLQSAPAALIGAAPPPNAAFGQLLPTLDVNSLPPAMSGFNLGATAGALPPSSLFGPVSNEGSFPRSQPY